MSETTLPHAPAKHRPSAPSCPTPALPPEPDIAHALFGPGAKISCRLHAECTAAANGRCILFNTSPPTEPGGTRCVYSECNVDRDCKGGAVCSCGDVANACLPGNCRLDRDCASGYCSPSFEICGGGITGYFCHSPDDVCIDDGDCDSTHFLFHCVADPASGVWGCPPLRCGA